eukprot:TRINITY_DN11462_c0_g1_i1.p1 TRINITY_DN11462_c0_g1~~TRINITY_DN11462_c0_g1_i1.p1  ORF type:complete len:550 (+),score=118.32 TRINITY_DN11462_c0_g1_i1:18-1667(+)
MSIVSPYPSVPLPEASLPEYLFSSHTFESNRNKKAFIEATTGRSLTFEDLLRNINSVSKELQKRGLNSGDIACLFLPNVIEFGEITHSILQIGAYLTTANPIYTSRELEHQLHDCEPKMVFTTEALLPKLQEALSHYQKITHVFVISSNNKPKTSSNPHYEIVPYTSLYNSLDNSSPPRYEGKKISPTATAALLYSSGTTGLPKGAVLSHRNLLSNLLQLRATIQDPSELQVFILVLPLFHCYGFQVILNFSVSVAATVVFLPSFSPKEFLAAIEKYQVTTAHVVPPVILVLSKIAESEPEFVSRTNLSSLRVMISGAAPLSPEVENSFVSKYGVRLKQAYGMTEASPVTHANPTGAIRTGSIGTVFPNMTAKIVDENEKIVSQPFLTGELRFKGPNIFNGYWGRTDNHQLFDEEGYFKSGDVAYFDRDGYFFLVDRVKELIKSKGFQVAPAELEGVLLSHDEIADAAVIGIEDEVWGEVPRAYVVLKNGAKITSEEIKDFVASQVAPYKLLRGGVIFVEAVPKSASGKILRRLLRDQARQEIKTKAKL